MRNSSFRLATFLTVLLALWLCASHVSATTYYVRTSGDDSNNGHNPGMAFQTLDKASTVVVSGDTVYVGAGTYVDSSVLDGVQQSTSTTSFIADTTGSYTGDAGPVIITNKLIGVVNCNNVEFHKFTFKDATMRPVLWKGSYDGLFKNCVFDGGAAPLLIKDGSVRFEDCQLMNFPTDAIYVDGEALLTLKDSTIFNCQEDGIEISKAARLVIDGVTIENNVGDGIKVAYTESSIDDGVSTGSGGITQRLVAGKYRIIASQGKIDGYDSTLGAYGAGNSGENADLYSNTQIAVGSSVPVQGDVYYGPSGSASVPNCSGTISQMSSTIAMDPIDVGDAATNNDNGSIPLTAQNKNPYVSGNLAVSGGDTLNLPPGTYYFSQVSVTTGGTLNITGPTTIYVTYRVTLSGGSIANPAQKPSNLKLLVTGSLVTLSGSSALHSAIYAPSARVTLSGSTSIYGMVVANEIIANSTGGIHVDTSLTKYAAEVQGLPTGGSSPSPPAGWNAIAEGDVQIQDSKFVNNRRGASVESAQVLTAENSYFINNNEWGLYLEGMFKLGECTISDNAVGGLWMKGVKDNEFGIYKLTIGDNPQYGIYLEDCEVTFDNSMLDNLTFTSGSDYILASQGGSLTLDGITISGGTVAGVSSSAGTLAVSDSTVSGSGYGISADQSSVTIDNCTLTGNTAGLYAHQNSTLDVTKTTLSNNTSWGAAVYLGGASTANFSSGMVSGNGGGIAFLDAVDGSVTVPDTIVQNNTGDGIRFENCVMTVNATIASGLQLINNETSINGVNSTLTVDGLTLSGGTTAAVMATGGSLTVANTKISSSPGSGIRADLADLQVSDTALDGNAIGIHTTGSANVSVTDTTVANHTGTGVYIVAPGNPTALSAKLSNCSVDNNAVGVYVSGAADGEFSMLNAVVEDNTQAGLYFQSCNLSLSNQSADNWQIRRNAYNIRSSQSTLVLSNVTLEDSTSYGLYCQDSDVQLANCTVSGRYGVYVDAANDSLTLDASRFTANSYTGWGVVRYGGDVNIKNSVFNGYWGSMYLYTTGVMDQATITNTTVGNADAYGIYVAAGDATVQNTIIHGSTGSYGLVRLNDSLTHSHNLIEGFTYPFYGISAVSTEIQKNPQFINAAGGDFHLASGSPAINSGLDTSAQLSTDMEGNARPSHHVFEIGAYEYTKANGSFRVLDWQESR